MSSETQESGWQGRCQRGIRRGRLNTPWQHTPQLTSGVLPGDTAASGVGFGVPELVGHKWQSRGLLAPTPHYKSHLGGSTVGKYVSWRRFPSSNTVSLSPSPPSPGHHPFQTTILSCLLSLHLRFLASPEREADSTQCHPHACQAQREWTWRCTPLFGPPCCPPVQQLRQRSHGS